MLLNKKTGTLLVAGLAAWAYYKYNKMSSAEKQKLTTDLKEKGRKFMDQVMPALKNKMGSMSSQVG